MAMESITATDPKKIAAAIQAFDIDGSNNTILFNDTGDLAAGNHAKIIIPNGRYSPEELAKEIERQLEANGEGQSYKVHYDTESNKFIIANNPSNANELFLLWESDQTTADFVLGFSKKIISFDSTNNIWGLWENGVQVGDLEFPPGLYTGEEFAEKFEELLNLQGNNEYSVSYNSETRELSVTNHGPDDAAIIWWALTLNAGQTFTATYPSGIAPGQSTTGNFTTGIPQVGDNRNALDIADIKNLSLLMNETLTFDSFHSIIVSGIGNDVSTNSEIMNNQKFMIEQYEQRRQSIAGVSLDEEMINLIKYQQAFTASAKMVTTLDKMLDTIISMK